ncbi:acyl-CoA dehydrogenase family protein [Halomarina ordinaria]|uniref:Acyl-CoA dehydrogenase family protein n=1 Tax=Halomarina ordinaria TaxID=3033939 RepID=A0ABD5UCT5_9EURY|nr:acyl-CoA dehydrogenase family protein [Halomarina sp. PSRA2]
MLALDEEQRMVMSLLSDIAEREFRDRACTWDGAFPWENLRLLGEHGLVGLNLPEEYGGGGMGEFEAMLAIEAVGRVCPDTANALYGQSMVAPRAIDMFGSEAAKERYLPPVCRGESALAIAISEPHAGSDAGAMDTHVVEDGGDLYLSGEKIWVSYVPESDAAVVWAYFPDDNLGTVVVDLDAPGVDVNEHYRNMAGHTQTHFFMDEVRIPAENVLVRGESALKEQLKALNWERCGSAAYANAIARCAFDHALDYAREREQFDRPIGDFQGIRWKLADMAARIESARSVALRAALTAEARGRVPDRLETSVAKYVSGQTVEHVVSEALQIHGATGYQRDHPLEYLYRLQRGRRIAAGTDEVMKDTIADALFADGLPGVV